MLRCGVDIIEIERISRVYRKRPRLFFRRFFTEREQTYLAGRKHVEKHLAARFAGKEAVFKLLGLGLGQLAWTDVEIVSLPGGEPSVILHGRALERARELDIRQIAISLSHSRDYATGMAVGT
ncbi:MAG: holo-ACP synthase [Bacillota bacterium]|nr:holo-ACP synthase [Bacillota bacterium]MDW7683675.1 holo-ACP synthase [Bacillota bacterium]